jgi:hypothetical protein
MSKFKTADELGITEAQRCALVTVMDKLEKGELEHAPNYRTTSEDTKGFNMRLWHEKAQQGCGTVCCIGGWAEVLSGVKFVGVRRDDGLENLFFPRRAKVRTWSSITPQQASKAIRNYLFTGDSKWDEVT